MYSAAKVGAALAALSVAPWSSLWWSWPEGPARRRPGAAGKPRSSPTCVVVSGAELRRRPPTPRPSWPRPWRSVRASRGRRSR